MALSLDEALGMAALDESDKSIHIDLLTRQVVIPESEKLFGVESDDAVEVKHIVIDGRYTDAGKDISELSWRVNFRNANGDKNVFPVTKVTAGDDSVEFDWTIRRSVVAYKGTIDFVVCAFGKDSDGKLTPEWNSTLGHGDVLEGLEVDAEDIGGDEILDELKSLQVDMKALSDSAAKSASDALDSKNAAARIKTEVGTLGDEKKKAITDESAKQQESIQKKGNDTLASIPEDYQQLTTDVGQLKEDLGDFFSKTESVNKFNKSSVEENAFYKNVDGTVTKSEAVGYVAFLLPVESGKTYTVSGTSYSVLTVGNNMEYLGYAWKSGETTFNTDLVGRKTELKYLAISFRTSSYPVDTYMAVEGDTLPEEYVPYDVHKEIKADVEIDYSQIINKPNYEKKYYVGAGKEHTSFTECIKSLPDDGLDKIVYVDGGVYDIFEEIGGAEYAQSIPESSEDLWRQYNTIIPSNTKIIGIGKVIFNFTPTSDQMTATSARYLSPLNVSGNVEIENITINADNCRYCIHDETSGIADFTGSVHKYKNVHLNKKRTSMGIDCAFGCGFNAMEVFEFDGCVFESNDRAISFHNRGADVDGTTITIKNSAFITNKNGTQRSLRFGNVNPKQVHIPVNIFNTYINGLIKIQNESSEKPNAFDLSLFNCGEKNVVVECTTNIYTPKVYN